MRLVVDTGPLIALSKTGHLDLLPRLFDDIVIPAAVLAEIAKPGETRSGSEIQNRSWITARGVARAARAEFQKSCDIAAGEAEAILIASEVPDSTVLLIDERRARRVAIERGLHTLRTGALLVAAARRNLVLPDDVRQALQILQHERYLDSRAAEDILHLLSNL